MTKDEAQVLKSIGMFVAIKVLLYVAINRAAKSLRESSERFDPNFPHTSQFSVATSTDIIGPHSILDIKPE